MKSNTNEGYASAPCEEMLQEDKLFTDNPLPVNAEPVNAFRELTAFDDRYRLLPTVSFPVDKHW